MKNITKRKIKALLLFTFKILLFILIFQGFIHLLKYPELCSTTLRRQLYLDLKDNNANAWTYYQNSYLANGIILYQDI